MTLDEFKATDAYLRAGDLVTIRDGPRRTPAVVKTLGNSTGPLVVVPDPAPTPRPGAEHIARLFHETYERLAPAYGYKTREASAKPWADVPADNRALMIAVAEVVARELVGSL